MRYARLFLPCLLAAWVAAADGSDALAQHLLELSGRTSGICSLPRGGDGLAVALARHSRLLVHVLTSAAELPAAQRNAESAGLFNRTVYIEEGDAAHNPLADWSADVLLVAAAGDADLERLAARDVKRVLAPYRGVVVVGRAKELGAGLDRTRLEAWLKKLDVPGGRIVADDAGLWAVATMPPLADGDDWTQYAHGPDQNRLSTDSALKWPYFTQWTAKPYIDGKFDIAVAAGGRLFRANATLAVDNTRTDGIIARSAYNGRVLWTRKTDDNFGTFGALIVATPEVVYIKDGNGVLCLDAETGAERKRFSLGDNAQGECKWLMLQDGILVTVVGQRPQEKSLRGMPATLTSQTWGKPGGYKMNSPEEFAAHQKWFLDYDLGSGLVAIDAASGRELWRQAAERIDPAKTAIAAGRVFYYANRSYAASLDLKTGATLWKTDAPIAQDPKGSGWSVTTQLTARAGALASEQVYLINSFKDGHYQAFAAQDGRILWGDGHGRTDQKAMDEARLGKLDFPVLMDGKLLAKSNEFRDPLTGKPTGEKLPAIGWGTCGSFCVSTHGIHGGGGTAYDRDSQATITAPGGYMKAACLSGLVAADGALFSGHGACVGCVEWFGHLTFCSAVALDETGERLRVGKAAAPTVTATPGDWKTYRADNSRCGSSAATVPAKATVRWTWAPTPAYDDKADPLTAPESASTQAICIGERVIFGTASGIIRCLDRQSGKELWNYATAGRIISAPSFWEGRIYAGSGDGCAYCLDAADGSLVWRYRVAPAERRIMIFGNLMSAWPVSANVLVQPDGKDGALAFVSAGLLGVTGGTTLCALDARTGALRWETRWPAAAESTAQSSFVRDGDGKNFTLDQPIDAAATGCAPEAVYHAMRLGTSATTYTFRNLPPRSACTVRLHFVEPWEKAAGKRLFDVAVNGQVGLSKFDIFAAAGGQNKAVVRELDATADGNGSVAVRFTADNGNNILVSGIELVANGAAVCKVQAGGGGVAQAGFLRDGDDASQPSVPLQPSATGQMAWFDGRLWLHVGDSGVLVVDPRTGAAVPAVDFNQLDPRRSTTRDHMRAATYGHVRGQDIGILPGGWVALGGRQFFNPAEWVDQPRNTCSFFRAKPDGMTIAAQGYPDVATLDKLHEGSSLPVWDAQETLLNGVRNKNPVLVRALAEGLMTAIAAHPFDPARAAKNYWNDGLRNPVGAQLPAGQQRPALTGQMQGRNCVTPVLAGNAIVFLDGWKDWNVVAVGRSDSAPLWDIRLPALPVFGGLSVNAAGDVLVPLVDGRVMCIGPQ